MPPKDRKDNKRKPVTTKWVNESNSEGISISKSANIRAPSSVKEFVRRISLPRESKKTPMVSNVKENVNCNEREQNKTDCENPMIDPDCAWNGDKCITEKAANKRITPMPFTGSNDTSGNADGTDNDLTKSGAPTNTGQKKKDIDDNMTQSQIEEAQKQAEANKEVTPTGTVTPPPIPPTPIPPTETPSPQEYTVSFEGTYDEEAKTFSGSLKIDDKTYNITSNPSMSSGVSSSSSPKTDDNIAAIQKMLPTIPGITFNIQEV